MSKTTLFQTISVPDEWAEGGFATEEIQRNYEKIVFSLRKQALGSSGLKKEWAHEEDTCLPLARLFFLAPTTSKRLLCRLKTIFS